jgi:single-strand DNA-binding protein
MLNKVMLIGNLGADPEIRFTQSGAAVATLSLATTRKWKAQDGQMQEETEWHRIVFFGRQAELCRDYLSKGSKIYVEGRLQTRKWQDQNGNDRYTTETVGREMQFLTPKGSGGGGGGGYSGDQGGGYGGSSSNEGSGGSGQNYGPPPSTGGDVPF